MQDFYHQLIDHFPDLKYVLLEAQTFDPGHYGFPEIYYKVMETDKRRIGSFQRAFERYDYLRDSVVCEAGVGRLALTKYYLPHCKKAYLIENNPEIIPDIKKVLVREGWSAKTELIEGDAMQVSLPEQVDFLIGELMSIFCANEYQVQIFRHLKQYLRPSGRMFPERILNFAQVGHADFEHGHKHYPLLFTRHWPELLGTQEMVNSIDFLLDQEDEVQVVVPFHAILSGRANCILMQSFVKITEGINFTGTDSLMPSTVLKLKEEVELVSGRYYQLRLSFRYGSDLNEAIALIEV